MQFISFCGIFVMLAVCFAFSRDRRAIKWRLVGTGLLLQAALGFTFLYWGTGNEWLRWVAEGVESFLKLSQKGSSFVFGVFTEKPEVDKLVGPQKGFVFAFMVLPTLIFFSSFMAVLYHLGVMQWVVRQMARIMIKLLGTSGSESLSACGNVFVGQTEAPLLVKPFLKAMTMSELHAVMVGGFATIAGGVFALYIGFGVDAGHLMVGSVMAVPAGLICTKMLWPETEQSQTMGEVHQVEASSYGNVVEAAAGGAGDGLKLALNVGAMLIAFLGLVEVMNAGLQWMPGDWSVQGVLAIIFYPIAAVMGVPGADVPLLAELLGTKLALTELVAYNKLGPMIQVGEAKKAFMENFVPFWAQSQEVENALFFEVPATAWVGERTALIASFALCGFANVGSVAIQVGGLGAMAPDRRSDLAKLGLRAMFAGAIATCLTACVAGVLSSTSA